MKLRSLCLAATLAFAAVAVAAPALADQQHQQARTTLDGVFARYVVSPHGGVMGLLLADGTLVKVRHSAFKVEPDLKPGQAVRVEGKVSTRAATKVVRRAVVSRAGVVVADGSHKAAHDRSAKPALAKAQAKARVAAVLPGHHGKTWGVVLDDGTTALFGWKGTENVPVKVGEVVSVEGKGTATTYGRGIAVETLVLASGETRRFRAR